MEQIDKYIGQVTDAFNKIAPQVAEVGLETTRMMVAQKIFSNLAFCILAFLFVILWWKKVLPWAKARIKGLAAHEDPFGYFVAAGIPFAITHFLAAASVLSPPWVIHVASLFRPEVYLAFRAIEKVMN